MTTTSPKRLVQDLVERMRDDATFEDIQYELYVLQQIERGLRDVEEGRVVSREDARAHLGRWLDPTSDA